MAKMPAVIIGLESYSESSLKNLFCGAFTAASRIITAAIALHKGNFECNER
jgi:hypothetical protein